MEGQGLVKCLTLENGTKYPVVGLGTWLNTDDTNMYPLIKAALDAGYRHFDTAIFYNNHKIMGEAFKKIYGEGKYKREEIYITTKYLLIKGADIAQFLQTSLDDLQMTYVDLFLIHWPIVPVNDNNEISHMPHHVAWAAMEELVAQGKTKSIGVSNFNVQSIMNLLSFCKIKPQNNQIELHPYLQQPELVQFCQRFNISVTAYSTLGHGGYQADKFMGNKVDIWEDETLKNIAKKHNKTLPQVVLNYFTSLNVVVIPKTSKAERLPENINIFDFTLDEQDKEAIKKLDKGIRTIDPTVVGGMGNPNWLKTPVFH